MNLNMEKPSKELKEKWHEDPANWKLGIFYFNKDDKRVFVSKLIRAYGWTMNFANPFSYLILIAVLIIIIASFLK
ncbi:MAG: hypothetical protein ABUL44_02985 [Flavobacterium sp.]